MAEYTNGKLVLEDQYYSDSAAITDEKGFVIFSAEQIPVLLGYSEKLGIPHWADQPGVSYLELTKEQQAANARRLVACWNACIGISTENLEQNIPVKELAERYNKLMPKAAKQGGSNAT